MPTSGTMTTSLNWILWMNQTKTHVPRTAQTKEKAARPHRVEPGANSKASRMPRDRCACGGRNKLVHAELLHDKPRHAHADACAEDGKQTRQAGDQKDLPCFYAACKQVRRPDVQHPDKQRTNRKNHQQNAEKNGGTMITNEKPSSRLVQTNFFQNKKRTPVCEETGLTCSHTARSAEGIIS